MAIASYAVLLDDASFDCELLGLDLEDLDMLGVLSDEQKPNALAFSRRLRALIRKFRKALPRYPQATTEANQQRRKHELEEHRNGRHRR
jgi:hypothetical protein